MIEKRIHAGGESYYFNSETDEKYGEIAGGFAWPETDEGFLVVAAVDFFETAGSQPRHIRVLAKSSESDTDTLFTRASAMQNRFSPFSEHIRFYGNTTSSVKMNLLDQFNQNRRQEGLDPFYLTEALHLRNHGNPTFYSQLLRRYTHPGEEILHFSDTSLPAYLWRLFNTGGADRALDHPPVAALAYALAVLSTWKPKIVSIAK